MSRCWLLVLVLAACGDDGGTHALPDAPEGDAVEIVDAPPGGSVTVTAWAGNAVRDDEAVVLFQSASGATVARQDTGVSGSVTGDVPSGGMVTVVQNNIITTIVQVTDGDAITVGNDVMATTGTATVTLPAAPGGTTNRQVITPCGSGNSSGTTVSVALSSACPQPATVLGVALAGANVQAFLVESATITAGGAATLSGAWTSPAQFVATIENLPASVTRGGAYASSRVGTASLYLAPTELPAPSGGMTSGMLAVPAAFGDGTDVGYFLGRGFDAFQQGFESVAGAVSSHTFDGAHLLPWIETKTPMGDQGVAWTQSSGDAYDGAIITFEFQYKGSTQLTWKVIVPSSARQFALPALPADFEFPTEANELEVHVELIESDAFDYAQMRARGGAANFRRDETLPAIRRVRSSFL